MRFSAITSTPVSDSLTTAFGQCGNQATS
jgi:hypothetical protein